MKLKLKKPYILHKLKKSHKFLKCQKNSWIEKIDYQIIHCTIKNLKIRITFLHYYYVK